MFNNPIKYSEATPPLHKSFINSNGTTETKDTGQELQSIETSHEEINPTVYLDSKVYKTNHKNSSILKLDPVILITAALVEIFKHGASVNEKAVMATLEYAGIKDIKIYEVRAVIYAACNAYKSSESNASSCVDDVLIKEQYKLMMLNMHKTNNYQQLLTRKDVEAIISSTPEGEPVDLSGRDLSNAQLNRLDLAGAILRLATLRGVDLQGVDLRGVDLRGADLRGADLRDTRIAGAKLDGAKIAGAIFV